jgi:hypothetical protein
VGRAAAPHQRGRRDAVDRRQLAAQLELLLRLAAVALERAGRAAGVELPVRRVAAAGDLERDRDLRRLRDRGRRRDGGEEG